MGETPSIVRDGWIPVSVESGVNPGALAQASLTGPPGKARQLAALIKQLYWCGPLKVGIRDLLLIRHKDEHDALSNDSMSIKGSHLVLVKELEKLLTDDHPVRGGVGGKAHVGLDNAYAAVQKLTRVPVVWDINGNAIVTESILFIGPQDDSGKGIVSGIAAAAAKKTGHQDQDDEHVQQL